MVNGKWEWKMGNGNGKWEMENGKWKMGNGKWEMGNGNGKWKTNLFSVGETNLAVS